MHGETLEQPLPSKVVFSHPGITFDPKKKERFHFTKDSKEILKQFIKNRLRGLDIEKESGESVVTTSISIEQVQATVDGLLSQGKSKGKILDFLERVSKIFKDTDSKPSGKFPEKIREKIEKNTKDERLDIYLEVDGSIVEVPLIVWKGEIHIDNIINTFNTRYSYHDLIGGRKK
ncbi:hypothetical protein KBB25_02725 [Candidatus Gracilibacteria bacterium]|nr:hypothetical protein [Candidatus Gracilibacteria bacterium]